MDTTPTAPVPIRIETAATLSLAIADWANSAGTRIAVFVAPDDATLQRLAAELPVFAPGHQVLRLPAWDSLPYDRARPSRSVTGARVATLAWLAAKTEQRAIVLTTPEALLQRVPPRERIAERSVLLSAGQELDPDWLHDTLIAFGYGFDDRVDQPGEAAIRGGTIDIHPAGDISPVRLELEDGRITAIRRFDPATQRTIADIEMALLLPTTEAFTVPGEDLPESPAHARERLLPDGELATIFDYLPDATFALTEGIGERLESWLDLVNDSFRLAGSTDATNLAPPDQIYLRIEECTQGLARHRVTTVADTETPGDPPLAASALLRRITEAHAGGDTVILCGDAPINKLHDAVARRLAPTFIAIHRVPNWPEARGLPPQSIAVLRVPLSNGFVVPGITVLALRPAGRRADSEIVLGQLAGALRIGDLVVDRERGLARLDGLVQEQQAGAPVECLRLRFLGGSSLLLPAPDIARIWRYGASTTLRPDRLDSAAWQARQAEIENEIQTTASDLVVRLRARAERRAPILERTAGYRAFLRRMPFAATQDQARAIRDVLQDLASGRPMYRLVCGDVGFGKTEVALHAAAIAAMAGKQVAVAAPTTVLARQHFETFRRRLSGSGIRVESLIRSTASSENRGVLRDLAAGEAQIVVGTHAVAAAKFHDLGLVIIDEEQRFGEVQKRQLRRVQDSVHALIMTATPLPRSLQSGLVGLIDVSLLTTPPAFRQPVRGFVVPFDPVVVRAALLNETRRGGQSFFVCSRIEDLDPIHARLRELAPELTIAVAHGKLRGDVLDRIMLGFANGNADVLLCTSIIEAGLDLPNANTMLIWRADRFGLAQLHQLRGRVGRGRVRARTYLLTDPTHPPTAAARKRLETVITLDSLGAGFAVSLADLDQRGAGDLFGATQAGHVRRIGTELYRDILQRALARARGEPVDEPWQPEIVIDAPAYVPEDFVPEPDTRLAIYRQIAALSRHTDIDAAAVDLDDRFGELPASVAALLDLARLRIACRTRGIARIQAGPSAVALTLRAPSNNGERTILPITEPNPLTRLRRLLENLEYDHAERTVQSV